jgi:hypothetical protein
LAIEGSRVPSPVTASSAAPADVAVGTDEQGGGTQAGGDLRAYEVDPRRKPEIGRDGSGQVQEDQVHGLRLFVSCI